MNSMTSVMKHDFARVPGAEIPRSSFDRSFGHKTTFDAGLLIPFFWEEVLPGDVVNLNANGFVRMATPIFPIMDNLYMDTHFFFVPYRIIWDNWEKMIFGSRDNPGDTTDYLVPQETLPVGGVELFQFHDYMGVPIGVGNQTVSALPRRSYNLIWNEWFRHQDLQNEAPVPTGDGPDAYFVGPCLSRNKRHDYFTSCLPWPSKDGQEVFLPLGVDAPVVPEDNTAEPVFTSNYGGGASNVKLEHSVASENSSINSSTGPAPGSNTNLRWQASGLIADLSQTEGIAINTMRQGFQVQRMFERDARSGNRPVEAIKAHFGVVSPDFRHQRPEFLGGGSSPIHIHPVTSTADTKNDVQQGSDIGTLSAFATGSMTGHGFSKAFTEHGIVLGLVSVRADLTYQQGLHKMWTRQDRFDHYWPSLANLGEQAVLQNEIWWSEGNDPEGIFGYQERFAEYRYRPSMITGQFRSTAAGTLDAWHLSQEFESGPQLNDAFMREDVPIDRVVAVPSEPDFIGDFYFNLKMARPMPVHGVPGNIDRF